MTKLIFVFYGFSGSHRRPFPQFPDGDDHDRSFQLVAETLGASLRQLAPSADVRVVQAWTKDQIVDALEAAAEGSVEQVHICCHGDSTMLSLAYQFAGCERLIDRAERFRAMAGSDRELALEAMRGENAIVTGYFSRAIGSKRRARLRAAHAPGASWQIWGCYPGYSRITFRGVGGASCYADHLEVVNEYLERFNLGAPAVDGVAVDIAKALGVDVTAARGHGGLDFWHGRGDGAVVKNDRRTPARKPFWLWSVARSEWVTFDSSGKMKARPEIFRTPRPQAELQAGRPPAWLTDLYWQSVAETGNGRAKSKANVISLSSQSRARRGRRRGRVESRWYDDGSPPPALFASSRSAWYGSVQAAVKEEADRESRRDSERLDRASVPVISPRRVPPLRRSGGAAELAPAPAPRPEPEVEILPGEPPAAASLREEDDDDFQRRLQSTLRGEGQHVERAQAQAARDDSARRQAPARRPRDPFARLHPDLGHAKTFDLGAHSVTEELDGLAERVAGDRPAQAESHDPRAAPHAPPNSATEVPELDDIDVLAALATVGEGGAVPSEASGPPALPLTLDRSRLTRAAVVEAIVARAESELKYWRGFPMPDGADKDESEPGRRRILAYYQEFLAGRAHDEYYADGSSIYDRPWSGLFIGYCMEKARQAIDAQPFFPARLFEFTNHVRYCQEAYRRRTSEHANHYWAWPVDSKVVAVGDVVVKERAGSGASWDDVSSDEDIAKPAHGDIVVSVDGRQASVIGGNLSGSVAKIDVELSEDGKLKSEQGYFALLRFERAE